MRRSHQMNYGIPESERARHRVDVQRIPENRGSTFGNSRHRCRSRKGAHSVAPLQQREGQPVADIARCASNEDIANFARRVTLGRFKVQSFRSKLKAPRPVRRRSRSALDRHQPSRHLFGKNHMRPTIRHFSNPPPASRET